jgi:phosphatidylinositol glycan class V
MLFIMAVSGVWAILYAATPASVDAKIKNPSALKNSISTSNVSIIRNLAVSQVLLALLTLITAHVQIITRISSACPVWVWFLAKPSGGGATSKLAKHAVTVMILYGIIQGALFASFLPPA